MRLLDMPRRTIDRVVNRVTERARAAGVQTEQARAKMLVLDIETAPSLSYLWSLWPRGGVAQVMQEHRTHMLSWAAKWLGDPDSAVMVGALGYCDKYKPGVESSPQMLEPLWELLNEADFVIAHNGDRFDVKRINTEFLMAGMAPPVPYRQIDTLKMIKRAFAFDSNQLAYVMRLLLGYEKSDSGGFETWRDCLSGSMEAWDRLVKYNIGDVLGLEEVYLRVRAWDKSHPSVLTINGRDSGLACPVCGGMHLEPTGQTVGTNVCVYNVMRCLDCGAPARERRTITTERDRSSMLVRAR